MSNYFIIKQFNNAKIYTRSVIITPELIGVRVEVHTGNKFVSLLIKESMIGYRFGEFIGTRRNLGVVKKKNVNVQKK